MSFLFKFGKAMATDRQIREYLTGETGCCTEPCGKCKGRRYVNHGGVKGCDARCPTCNGNGAVFRTDDAGRELISAAVKEWDFNLSATTREKHFAGLRDVPVYNQSHRFFLFVWDNRQGQSWQSALEQHVREYVEQFTYTLEGLKKDLQAAGKAVELYLLSTGLVNTEVFKDDVTLHGFQSGYCSDELAALKASVEAAMG